MPHTTPPKIRRAHFMAIPNIALEELTDPEFKLYAYYVQQARGKSKTITFGCGLGAKIFKWGTTKFSAVRKSLHAKGYIILTESPGISIADHVRINLDIWARNEEKYGNTDALLNATIQDIEKGVYTKTQRDQLMNTLIQAESAFVPEDTGVPENEDGGSESEHEHTQDQTRSYIEKKEKPEIIDEVDNCDIAVGDKAQLSAEKEMPAAQPLESEETKPDIPDYSEKPVGINILDRALTRELVKLNEGQPLEKHAIQQILKEIVVSTPGNPQAVYPSLVDCYDQLEGFQLFFEERVENFKKSYGMNIQHLISNLRYFSKEGGWSGWLKWKEDHPEYTTELTDPNAPAPIVVGNISPEAGSRWLDNVSDIDVQETE